MVDANERVPLVVNTVACVSSKPLFSKVASQIGWAEQAIEPTNEHQSKEFSSVAEEFSDTAIYCGMSTRQLLTKNPLAFCNSWVTQYVGLSNLCDKGNFARMAMVSKALCPPHTWEFDPRTWLLPEQYELVVNALQKESDTYIFKPKDGSQGEGIFLAQSLPEFTKHLCCRENKSMVCQQYLATPLLLDGFKFDLRMYVCLLGGSAREAPQVLLCREGLARFCTERYEKPSSTNIQKALAHLTNYSLNKTSDNFKCSGQEMPQIFDPRNRASKRPLTVALSQIEEEHPGFDRELFYDKVAELVQTAFSAMTPLISAYHRSDGHGDDIRAVQILGLDVILTRDFRPILLEINNSPSLRVSDPESLRLDDSSLSFLTKVLVERGGTASVNTSYIEGCLRRRYYLRSFYSCNQKHGLHCAMAIDDCPAGWYITEEMESGGYYNIYYHPRVDPNEVPQSGWVIYKGRYSKPGFRPLPEVKVVSDGCHLQKGKNVCLCYDWHDMAIPHTHKFSPVDLAVKSIVVKGAFQLLEQFRQGSRTPRVEAYINVEIMRTDLYALLTSVEALFIRCGLQGDWKTAFAKRRLKEIFWMFVEEGNLDVEDLDRLASQSVFKFISYTGPPHDDPLHVFDFLELLKKIGSRVFPTEEPRNAMNLVLRAVENGLVAHAHHEAIDIVTEPHREETSCEEEEEPADLQPLL